RRHDHALLPPSKRYGRAKIPVPVAGVGGSVACMTASRSRLLLACAATAGAAVLATATAPALTVRATPKRITAAGVGAVKLGATYTSLRAAGLVGRIGPGCELAGPQARAASLRAPLRGTVDFTQTSPRKVAAITIRRGATARGVGIGASGAQVRRAYPKAIADHGTEAVFGITLLKVPRSGGGRIDFALDKTTKRVTLIAVPRLTFCE
ncbi:MAG: hypothetical protein QOG56_3017, partial [Solirubrobacteraceae bacterium]|nr:hypothetical protein [Solirubrobacteraceae bacterium]